MMFRVEKQAAACHTLRELGDMWREFQVIGIDEGQFFDDVSKKPLYRVFTLTETDLT